MNRLHLETQLVLGGSLKCGVRAIINKSTQNKCRRLRENALFNSMILPCFSQFHNLIFFRKNIKNTKKITTYGNFPE